MSEKEKTVFVIIDNKRHKIKAEDYPAFKRLSPNVKRWVVLQNSINNVIKKPRP